MTATEAWTSVSNLQNDHVSLLLFNPDDTTYLLKNVQEKEGLHGTFLPGGSTTAALNTWSKVVQTKLNELVASCDVGPQLLKIQRFFIPSLARAISHVVFYVKITTKIKSKIKGKPGLRWMTAAQIRAAVSEGCLLASPELADLVQLVEAREDPATAATAAAQVALDEKGGGYIYVLTEQRSVKLPHEALLESAKFFKQGDDVDHTLVSAAGQWRRRDLVPVVTSEAVGMLLTVHHSGTASL